MKVPDRVLAAGNRAEKLQRDLPDILAFAADSLKEEMGRDEALALSKALGDKINALLCQKEDLRIAVLALWALMLDVAGEICKHPCVVDTSAEPEAIH